MSRRTKRKQEFAELDDDDDDVGIVNFTLSQQAPEPSQSIPTERPSERNNL
jgi:hypothetical protein